MFHNSLLVAIFICLFALPGISQAVLPQTNSDKSVLSHGGHDDDASQNRAQQEMLKNLEIKRGETTYRQNVDRAKESAQLGVELREAYNHNHSFSSSDIKKLNHLEKLARQIRSEAGGSDDEEKLKDPPHSLEDALGQIVNLTDELYKGVEKTPKHVISVVVIEHANQLIQSIRYTRTLINP